MNDDDRDDARLQALFDRTADEPTAMELMRMAARAADAARPRRNPYWAFLLGGGLAAAAAAASVVVISVEPPIDTQPSASAVAEIVSPPLPEEVLASLDDDALDGFGDDEDDDEAWDFGVEGPRSPADVESWLLATAAVLEEVE